MIKKIILIIWMGLCLTGCVNSSLEEISIPNYKSFIENKETFILYIGSTTCSSCETYKPKLEKILKEHGLTSKYINIEKISKEELGDLVALTSFTGTPTTIFYVEGKEETLLNRINGDVSEEVILEKLKNTKFIK